MKKHNWILFLMPAFMISCILPLQVTLNANPGTTSQPQPFQATPVLGINPTIQELLSCRVKVEAATTSDWTLIGIDHGGYWEDVDILSVSEGAESLLTEENQWILLSQDCGSESECGAIQTVFDFTLKDFDPHGTIRFAIERGAWGMTWLQWINLGGVQPVTVLEHTFDWTASSGPNIDRVEVPVVSLCQFPMAQENPPANTQPDQPHESQPTATRPDQPDEPQPTATQPAQAAEMPTQTGAPPTATMAPTPTVDTQPPNLLYVDLYPDVIYTQGGDCPDSPRIAISNLSTTDEGGIYTVFGEWVGPSNSGTVIYQVSDDLHPGYYYGQFGPFDIPGFYQVQGAVIDNGGNTTPFTLHFDVKYCGWIIQP